jgi:ATP-binding cassette subfamily F protein uup
MNLVSLKSVQHGYGGPPLLEDVSIAIGEGERVCLVGRNGEGKSTLMKIIAGDIRPDSGEISRNRNLVMARLSQEVPQGLQGTVFDVVASALGEKAVLIKEYHHVVSLVAVDPSAENLERLSSVQHELENQDGWKLEQEVEQVISRLSLPADSQISSLSGGLKRRVLLAQALVNSPDLLLLDEPTNHLDLASIDWMEKFLLDWKGALLFITHDRQFLKRLATRIIELDRGRATDWPGDYDNYLRRREERLHAEAKANERFDKKLAQEEVWIRQGIKARRTRNEGRVRALKAMRDTYQQRRQQQGQARLQMQKAELSGKIVIDLENVSYSWDSKPIISDFSLTILRGDRIGIIGPNGAGKSTLLNLMLGRLTPQSGKVEAGSQLEVVFFDQLRDLIRDEATVLDNVAEGSDQVVINGKPRHIMSYLQDFLFTPDRARQPASALSGGERNRLLLAKLFLKPSNLLVLDEPTNDLDVETLELLEELLSEYAGTLLLVSHDRQFLDNVVTATLVLEGNGRVGNYVGGYSDWENWRKQQQSKEAKVLKQERPLSAKAERAAEKPKKLSYKLQRELDELPVQLESHETLQAELTEKLSDPGLYRDKPAEVTRLQQQLEQVESELQALYDRWEELEAMK